MMGNEAKIYHNPRCSKSREALSLLEQADVSIEIIRYLDNPPSASDILNICDQLGARPIDLVRSKEALFSELGLSLSDERSDQDWANILHRYPKLLERPIVIVGDRAALGRPPEQILDLLQGE